MFEAKSAMFLYCTSPVHMGAGTALGAVDNPIQRERHTEHPMMAGSGLKGALRDVFESGLTEEERKDPKSVPNRIFGPSAEASDHAGCLSVADGQLVLFPVRSLRSSFVYATCPTALARLKRLLVTAGVVEAQGWEIPGVDGDRCGVVEDCPSVKDGKLVLEAYEFAAETPAKLGDIASWLQNHALPGGDGHAYFAEKLGKDLVVLSDTRFGYFVRHATVVEPHVRIDDTSGTADDGGLFYTENLPPESLLVSLVMASKERVKKGDGDADRMEAPAVLEQVQTTLGGTLTQVGGDATTGRGHVVLRFAGGA